MSMIPSQRTLSRKRNSHSISNLSFLRPRIRTFHPVVIMNACQTSRNLARTILRNIFLATCLIVGCSPLLAALVIPEDRLPPGGRWDRSKVGVEGGIPNVQTIFANVKEAPYNAKGDGIADDTSAIQQAVAACPNGQVVYIPEGTYLLRDQIYVLTTNDRSIVIRGAGPTKTKLLFTLSNYTNCISFNGSSLFATQNVVSGFERGSKTLVTDGNGPFTSGMVLFLFQGNGSGDLWAAAQGRAPDGCIHQSFNVVSADSSGHSYNLSNPIYYGGYTTDRSVSPYLQVGFGTTWAERCGVEDLYLENSSPKGNANIFFQGARNCWVKNVESAKAAGWNIRFQYSRQCEVRDCIIHDGWNGGGDTIYGVGFYKMNCDNLVENNIFYHCRHSMITEFGNQGNVFGYNYSFDPVNEQQLSTDFLMGDMIAHGGLPMFNLYEGNIVARLSFDFELGGSRNLTAFRNWVWRKGLKVGTRAVDLARNAIGNNIVGNIFLTPGQIADGYDMDDRLGINHFNGVRRFGLKTDGDVDYANADSRIATSTLWHMNWDFAFQGTINYRDPSIFETTLPASYYYTSRPSWWKAGLPWPSIGPDLAPKTGSNPAMLRWKEIQNGKEVVRPPTPTSLRETVP